MGDEHDQKILGGALKAILTVLMANGNNTVVGTMFADGRFFKVKIIITEVKEE